MNSIESTSLYLRLSELANDVEIKLGFAEKQSCYTIAFPNEPTVYTTQSLDNIEGYLEVYRKALIKKG